MEKPTLLILCGLPFAGKTTLSIELEKYGFIRVTVDDVNIELGIEFSLEKQITYDEWTRAQAAYYRKIRKNLEEGKSVVCDAVAYLFREREELRDIAKSCNVRAYVIYIPTPESVVKKRWLENKKTKERQDIREEDFEDIIKHFQIPTEQEHIHIYTNGDNAKEWIEKTIKNL